MDIAAKLLLFAGLMLLAIPIALWHAFCLTVMWEWYAPSAFGVLSMKTAVGISLGVDMLTMRAVRDDDPSVGDRITMAIVGPAVGLLASRLFLFFV